MIVKILFSPRDIDGTPSSQPQLCQPMAEASGGYRCTVPLITLPTPMAVSKSPRPLDESNLRRRKVLMSRVSLPRQLWRREPPTHVLLASVVVVFSSCAVVQIACILNRNLISFAGIVLAVALLDDFLCDAHCARPTGVTAKSGW